MLVALENSPSIINGITLLSKQYPNETARFFGDFLVIPPGQLCLEKDGALPKKITFLGRYELKDKIQYSNYVPDIFVGIIIQQIETATMLNPEIKKSLVEINLLDCREGLVSSETDNSFVDEIAKRIKEAGYDILVRAASNLQKE